MELSERVAYLGEAGVDTLDGRGRVDLLADPLDGAEPAVAVAFLGDDTKLGDHLLESRPVGVIVGVVAPAAIGTHLFLLGGDAPLEACGLFAGLLDLPAKLLEAGASG